MGSSDDDTVWQGVLAGDPSAVAALPLYAPLIGGALVLGRIAQSLDGRIATLNGESFWISGPDDILHTHRLRALFDAVLVGAGTVRADDPLLTTRRCAGASPVRVVLDTERRLTESYRLFRDGPPTLLVCAEDRADGGSHGAAEVVGVPRQDGGLDLTAVLAALAGRGLRRIFIEGGGVTVSRFLAAGLLDRLHVTVAPLLLGEGIPAFAFAGVSRPEEGMRLTWDVYRLGADVLLDIP
ncbi:MAG: RibD family protein, partial [Alphaproteobacteria bacterium]|nr:RibD family protein [Alphaproteobacteria bacterium]